jgi:hypothetical protein
MGFILHKCCELYARGASSLQIEYFLCQWSFWVYETYSSPSCTVIQTKVIYCQSRLAYDESNVNRVIETNLRPDLFHPSKKRRL